MNPSIVAQGAEAVIYKVGDKIIKERSAKGYRHPDLDTKIRKHQTRREAKVLEQLQDSGVTPQLLSVDDKSGIVEMEFIPGDKLADSFSLDYMKQLGSIVAMIHNRAIIHGDLTTSNMIVQDGKVFLIDFGLSFQSDNIEDKTVDVHVLKEALEAKHFAMSEEAFSLFLETYMQEAVDGHAVVDHLNAVELRGRYKKKEA